MQIQKKAVVERLKNLGLLPVAEGQTCSFVDRNEELQKALSRVQVQREEVVEEQCECEDCLAEEMATLRDLIESIRDVMTELAESVIFEKNDEKTRRIFVEEADEYFNDLQCDGIIDDYYIVCDDTNNTPETIDKNQFRAAVYLKPSNTDKYISMDMCVGPPEQLTQGTMTTTVAEEDEWQWYTIDEDFEEGS